MSKESGPKGPAFVTTGRDYGAAGPALICLHRRLAKPFVNTTYYWSHGVVESWSNGKTEENPLSFTIFHHSNTPLIQYSLKSPLRQSRRPLATPRGCGFCNAVNTGHGLVPGTKRGFRYRVFLPRVPFAGSASRLLFLLGLSV